jgi:hypothetical protein
MRKMWQWLLVIAILAIGGVLLTALTSKTWGVGHTDVEVSFVVTDGETGGSLVEARVEIRKEKGGLCEDQEEKEFAIFTNHDGVARRVERKCMCFGTSSIFEDSFGTHLPRWLFRVSAEGYTPTRWSALEVYEHYRRVRRGKEVATLTVPIALRKKLD